MGFQHDDKAGTTVFSVSNRQKPMTVHYGPEVSGWFDFRLDLALAHYRNDVPALVAQLQDDVASLDARKPPPPVARAPRPLPPPKPKRASRRRAITPGFEQAHGLSRHPDGSWDHTNTGT